MTDDITFCGNDCDNTKCCRYRSNIKEPQYPHSVAYLAGTEDCEKKPTPKTKSARLVDADALKKAIEQGEGFSWDSHGKDDLCVRKKYIDNAPTVDAYTFNQVKELFDLNVQMANEIETLKRLQGEWIPVSERLPEYSGLYLISVDDVVTVANFTGTYFMHRGGGRVEVYAWQPLPEPYKKGGAKNER